MPWASYVLAPLSFFSAYDAPVLPPYPQLARLQSAVPVTGRAVARFARWVTRRWAEPVYRLRNELGSGSRSQRHLRRQTRSQPGAGHVLAAARQTATRLAGEHRDYRLRLLRRRRRAAGASPEELEQFLQAGEPPVVFTLGSAAVLDAGPFYEQSAQAALAGRRPRRPAGRHGPAQSSRRRSRPTCAWSATLPIRRSFLARRSSCTRAASALRRRLCRPAAPCW